MSFLKLILGIAFMGLLLYFASLNLGETITLRLWVGEKYVYPGVPLVLALLGAFLLGMILYFVLALARDVRLRARIARLRRENKTLLAELHQLRGSALDDLPASEAVDGITAREITK